MFGCLIPCTAVEAWSGVSYWPDPYPETPSTGPPHTPHAGLSAAHSVPPSGLSLIPLVLLSAPDPHNARLARSLAAHMPLQCTIVSPPTLAENSPPWGQKWPCSEPATPKPPLIRNPSNHTYTYVSNNVSEQIQRLWISFISYLSSMWWYQNKKIQS